MAEKEMADYFVGTMTADYTTTTLSVTCQVDMEETPRKRQKDFEYDDGSIDTVNLSDTVYWDGYLQWPNGITKSNAGTVTDFYTDSTKADFKRRSIYWAHPTDSYTYVIKFRGPLTRLHTSRFPNLLQIPKIPIRILGVKA